MSVSKLSRFCSHLGRRSPKRIHSKLDARTLCGDLPSWLCHGWMRRFHGARNNQTTTHPSNNYNNKTVTIIRVLISFSHVHVYTWVSCVWSRVICYNNASKFVKFCQKLQDSVSRVLRILRRTVTSPRMCDVTSRAHVASRINVT